MSNKSPKIIVILGQTATGKSALGVRLAKKFNGEIISADSRQVYKGLDIGTGKITKKEMRGVPHHMLDVASPRRQYTAAEYKKKAEKIIRYIVRKGKTPIVVGGTGFYIDTLLGTIQLPNIPPNKKLRARLKKKTAEQLFAELKKRDPKRAKTIDKHNKVRLIRALEIVHVLGKVPQIVSDGEKYKALKIGIKLLDKKLKQNIAIRLFERISRGMIAEVKRLYAQGVSWKRMEELGLEYRYLARFLKQFPHGSASDLRKSALQAQLETAIWQYARRQKTWFKRDKNIKWFTPSSVAGFKSGEYKKMQEIVKNFLAS